MCARLPRWLLIPRLLMGALGLSLLATAATAADPFDVTGTWTPTGSFGTAREAYSVTLLPTGKVLVAGGEDASRNSLFSAELYDPATGTWTPTGSLGTARLEHTATLLPNAKVLVAGGIARVAGGTVISATHITAELYDPATGTWSPTGSLGLGRRNHTATLLPSAKVLVAGGRDASYNTILNADLYDPATGTWIPTSSLGIARLAHTATLLYSGKVLVAGGVFYVANRGYSLISAELYDPATGTWTPTANLGTARTGHTATLLPNGKVLVASGASFGSPGLLSSAELYDPATGTWTPTGDRAFSSVGHSATLLPNGKVLVAGGAGPSGMSERAELYDPATGTWSRAADGGGNSTTMLPNAKVLAVLQYGAQLYNAEFTSYPPSGVIFSG